MKEYSNTAIYKKGDRVTFEGKIYVCSPPFLPRKGYFEIANRNPPTDERYWKLVVWPPLGHDVA